MWQEHGKSFVNGPVQHGSQPLNSAQFVNALSDEPGRRRINVGATGSLLPCTTRLDYSIIDLKAKGYRLVVVDTPGFDNPDKPFMSILEEILTWLRESWVHLPLYQL